MPLDSGYHGKNFAPVQPLTDAKNTVKRGGSSSMSAFFREIYQEIKLADSDAWREQIEMGNLISNFRAGKLIMKRDLAGSGFVFLKPLPSSSQTRDRSNYPLFPQNSETLKAKWSKARPSVIARCFGDGYKTEIQMNSVNRIVKSYFKDIFTPVYELNEAISCQDFGTYLTRFYYDDRLNQMRQLSPILKNESKVLMDGYAACYECAFEGAPQDFAETGAAYPQCPKCGSFKTTKMIDPQMVDEQQIVGVEEISQGDITGSLLPFPACKFDCRQLAHNSSYFLYSQYIPIRLARQMFGDIDLDHGDTNDYGLSVMESLAARGGHIEGLGESSIYNSPRAMGERAVMSEMWLSPDWYAGFELDSPEKTVSGESIPAGIPLEKIFPEKLCVVGFNDMNLQVGIYGEKPNIVGGVYFLQSFSGLGKGLSDSVDIAKDMNEIHSMAMAEIKRYGASGVYFEKDAIAPNDVKNLFNPRKAVPVNMNGKDDIRKMVGQVQFSPVNPALPLYQVQLANLMNMSLLTGDFTQGMTQDVDINTFGGQQLAHAKSEEQKGAILTMKVHHRELSAQVIIDLFRKHIKIPRFYSGNADRHSTTKGKFISGADLPDVIKFDAVPDSEIPTNSFEKRQSAKEMVKEAGGLPVLMQMAQSDPKLTGWYADQFGVELPMLNQDEIWIVCLSRLQSIKELSEMFNDPEQILQQLEKPLYVREFGHLMKSEFLGQILDDDEVATWNPIARNTVQLLIERHRELQIESEMLDEMIKQNAMLKLQQKQMAAQQAMMQPQIDAQNAQMAQQQEQQLIGEVVGRIADEESKDAEHERTLDKSEADHARNLELEEVRAKNQANQVKNQQKPKQKG